MITTYPSQRRIICDHLYLDHGGYFILTEASRDLFGAPIVGGGYLPIRSLDYDEAMTIMLTEGQGLLSVYPLPTSEVFGSHEKYKGDK